MVENGQIVIRRSTICDVYDHRIIDGREAVLGLVTMKEALEDPASPAAGRLISRCPMSRKNNVEEEFDVLVIGGGPGGCRRHRALHNWVSSAACAIRTLR